MEERREWCNEGEGMGLGVGGTPTLCRLSVARDGHTVGGRRVPDVLATDLKKSNINKIPTLI